MLAVGLIHSQGNGCNARLETGADGRPRYSLGIFLNVSANLDHKTYVDGHGEKAPLLFRQEWKGELPVSPKDIVAVESVFSRLGLVRANFSTALCNARIPVTVGNKVSVHEH